MTAVIRRKSKKITKEEIKTIEQMVIDRYTCEEIANLTSRTVQSIYNIRRKFLPHLNGLYIEWSQEERDYLEENAIFSRLGIVENVMEIAKHLKRSNTAVSHQVRLLREEGIFPDIIRIQSERKVGQSLIKKMWSQEEETFLLRQIQLDSINRVANLTSLTKLMNRSKGSISGKIKQFRREGKLPSIQTNNESFKKYQKFTKLEKEILVDLYTEGKTNVQIAQILQRTDSSIQKAITRYCQTDRQNNWTEEEWSQLVNLIEYDKYQCIANWDVIRAAFPHRTYVALRQQVLKLRKSQRILSPTGASEKSREIHSENQSKLWAYLKTDSRMNRQRK